uniref:ABC transporter n=1 Tax=Bionectria ochroleuca TaxID=29856 RepID=A0A8H7KFW9_BIOOC
MAVDDEFGPGLVDTFDFTLLFEQSFFPCFQRQYLSSWFLTSIYGGARLSLLVLWIFGSGPKVRTSVAESAVGIVEAIVIAALSLTEHVRSQKSSLLLSVYLFLSLLLHIPFARSLWIRENTVFLASAFTFLLVVKAVLLAFEEIPRSSVMASPRKYGGEYSAGMVSRTLFWWLNRLFYLGFHRAIEVDDLGDINDKFDSHALLERLEKHWNQDPQISKTALMRCTFAAYKWQFFAGVVPRLMYSGFGFAQPFLISSVIAHVRSPQRDFASQMSGILIAATVFIYTLSLRTCCAEESASITLMSTDIDSIVTAGESLHDMWCSFLDLGIGIYLLYCQIGLPSLLVLVPTTFTTVLSAIIGPAMEPALVDWKAAIQRRVAKASDMLGQMKGIKMIGLTGFFHSLVRTLRLDEIKISYRFRWLLAGIMILSTFSSEITPVLIILCAKYWPNVRHSLDISKAFTSLAIISLVTQPLVLILTSIMQIAGVFGSFSRIQAFLHLDEQEDFRGKTPVASMSSGSTLRYSSESTLGTIAPSEDQSIELSPSGSQIQDGTETDTLAITISHATFQSDDGLPVLHDIHLKIPQGAFTIVTGRVGCGKTSLLKAIVGEIVPGTGYVSVLDHRIGYCDQTPWVQNTSIKANIVGQSPLDDKWFSQVVQCCALDEDLAIFPLGDQTFVGSNGVALSGGQRQRVALARAIYQKRDILILDDVFSGVDNRTSRNIFHRLMGPSGLLRQNKTTIVLATSNVHFLPGADYITILRQGSIIRNQVTYQSLQADEWGTFDDESFVSNDGDGGDDDAKTVRPAQEPEEKADKATPTPDTDNTPQTSDSECYKIYLNSFGWKLLILVLGLKLLHTALEAMPLDADGSEVYLKLWTERSTHEGPQSIGWPLGYVSFVCASIILASLGIGLFIIIGIPKSAAHLHEKLLRSVCRAPLYFFAATDSGSTINRFSQDMSILDQTLPLALYMSLSLLLQAITRAGVIASGATYVSALILPSFLILFLIQKIYLRTSKQLRFMDLEMRAPLYTHFTETLAGLSTIRAFGWSDAFLEENTRRLSMSQKPFYFLFCIQRWLQIVLDLFVAGMALVLVSMALMMSRSTSEGQIALAMVTLLGFNHTLTLFVDQWTQVETSLGAIARLKVFMRDTPNEDDEPETTLPLSDWPAQGAIEFEDISACYSDTGDVVLRNISLFISPGQKVCICGRSGSGKSSLILTLLRLVELRSGKVLIDGVDLSTVPRQHIRSCLNTVPQDPIRIGGNVRLNLDPEGRIQSDELLIEALNKVMVWPMIQERGGLEAQITDLGFSVGQMQLFSLARALLSRSRVVLLDEATSSIDRTTDEEIRRILRAELRGRTVIEVVHRLEIVRDFDLVIVMGHGEILETGSPEELLAQPSSELRKLYDRKGV